MKKGSHKVEDGKMVKIGLETDNNIVEKVNIRGDFFLEPPEKLEDLEKSITGLKMDSSIDEIVERTEDVEAELIGFTHRDLGEAFRKAVEGDEE